MRFSALTARPDAEPFRIGCKRGARGYGLFSVRDRWLITAMRSGYRPIRTAVRARDRGGYMQTAEDELPDPMARLRRRG
jgi:hypothetical protein